MAKEKYNGSIPLASGIIPYNEQDYPLVEAHSVLIEEDGIRLDEKLKSIGDTEEIKNTVNQVLVPLKTQVDEHTNLINSNTQNISLINADIAELTKKIPDEKKLESIGKDHRIQYDEESNLLYLYWVETDPSTGEEQTLQDAIDNDQVLATTEIKGGGGGGSAEGKAIPKLTYLTPSSVVKLFGTEVSLGVNFLSYTSDDPDTPVMLGGVAVIRVNNEIKERRRISAGDNWFDVTNYLRSGDNTVRIQITNDDGISKTATWGVAYVDMKISSSFDDTKIYTDQINIYYTPYGNIAKDVYLEVDGKVIASEKNVTVSNRQLNFVIPKQTHGDHTIRLWLEAKIGDEKVKSNILFYDAIWVEEGNNKPVIRADYDGSPIEQYANKVINYSVYVPNSETAEISFYIDDALNKTELVDREVHQFVYRPMETGRVKIAFKVGSTIKEWNITITQFPFDIEPITAGLQFDFNPVGRSNNEVEGKDKYTYNGYNMTVSENFDWYNGGWRVDEDGCPYFKIMTGDRVSFDYPLFGDYTKDTGKNFKFIFQTENCRSIDAELIRCYSESEASGGSETEKIGIIAKAQRAYCYNGNSEISTPYCEDTLMELEFNIQRSNEVQGGEHSEMVFYQASDPSKGKLYDASSNFDQRTIGDRRAKSVVFGSDNCDLRIYRFKAYNTSLTMNDTFQNYLADSLTPTEMYERYKENDILDPSGELDYEKLSRVHPELRILLLKGPRFTHDKKDKVGGFTVQQIMGNGDERHNWINEDVEIKGQGTSSNEYGASARNIDLKFKGEFSSTIEGSDLTFSKYAMTENSVPINYFNVKVNVASSENANNAVLADDYNNYQPYIRPIRQANPKVRDTMEFHPCVILLQETSDQAELFEPDGKYHFYACGDLGNSKKNGEAMGMLMETDEWKNTPDAEYECIIEFSNNTTPQCLFKKDENNRGILDFAFDKIPLPHQGKEEDLTESQKKENAQVQFANDFWDGQCFEFRYPDSGDLLEETDPAKLKKNKERLSTMVSNFREMWNWVETTDTSKATNVRLPSTVTIAGQQYTNDTVAYRLAKFKNEYKNYFVSDSILYHLLFIERHTMIDNLAKNTFIHYNVNGPYAGKWDYIFDYDNDTADGNNNSGDLVYPYGLEIGDKINNAAVFNGDTSVLWHNVKNSLTDELQLLANREGVSNAWDGQRIIRKFNEYQDQKPARLQMLDMWRKYFRPYEDGYRDNEGKILYTSRFFNEMMYGRKKYQRKMYETYQNVYYGTQYETGALKADILRFRSSRAQYISSHPNNYLPAPEGVTVTPFSDMYVIADYDQVVTKKRAKAGVPTVCPYPNGSLDLLSDTNTRFYGGSYISSLGDLAPLYIRENEFGNGRKLTELLIGKDDPRYQSTWFQGLSIDNSAILTKLDLSNNQISNGNRNINARNNPNLLEIYTTGSNVSTIEFANGGLLEKAKLNNVQGLILRNLPYIKDFTLEGYTNLTSLLYENCSDAVPLATILREAVNLNRIRLIDIDLTFQDTTILNRIANMQGITNTGATTEKPTVTGHVHVGIIRPTELEQYRKLWPEDQLEITYDKLQAQKLVIFYNDDADSGGEKTELYRIYVDENNPIPDPVTLGYIQTPTKQPSEEFQYIYTGWDRSLSLAPQENPTVITATYRKETRRYTIVWYNDEQRFSGLQELDRQTVLYGQEAVYTGETPVKQNSNNNGESYLFKQWDKSTGFVRSDMSLYPIWETGSEGPADPENTITWNAAQIKNFVSKQHSQSDIDFFFDTDVSKITVEFGYNPVYSNINETVLVEKNNPLILDGKSYLDTGIKLLEEDTSWTLVVDLTMAPDAVNKGNTNTFISCGTGDRGLSLSYIGGSLNRYALKWGSVSNDIFLRRPRLMTAYDSSIGDDVTYSDKPREILVIRHIKGDTNLYCYTQNRATVYKQYNNGVLNDTFRDQKLISSVQYTVSNTLTFGAERTAAGDNRNYAYGTINYAKLYHADLGHAECKQIASWIYETMEMQYVGKEKYTIPNSESRSTLSFVSTKRLLDVLFVPNLRTGGWKYSDIRKYMNNRLLYGLSPTWQQLLLEVEVRGYRGANGYGSGSTPITQTDVRGYAASTEEQRSNAKAIFISNDKIYAPSNFEVSGGDSSNSEEANDPLNGKYPCFSDNRSRVAIYPFRQRTSAPFDYVPYPWTLRTPSSSTGPYVVNYDGSINSSIRIPEYGGIENLIYSEIVGNQYDPASASLGVIFGFSV